jgi:hypothetical protein
MERPAIKVRIFSLATDDDGGTSAQAFGSERAMEDALIEGTGGMYSSYTRADFDLWKAANPDGDLSDWWEEHRGDLDTYSTDEEELDVPLPPIAKQLAGASGAAKVEMALALLIEARELIKAADNQRTLQRVRAAISSCKGARRIQTGRRVRAEIERHLGGDEYLVADPAAEAAFARRQEEALA